MIPIIGGIGGPQVQFHQTSAVYSGMVSVKSVVSEKSSRLCRVEVWREEFRLSCRPRHLTATQIMLSFSKNSPHVASEREVNLTKLNLFDESCYLASRQLAI
ncbi:hypothetical protein AVEN_212065-1 [Araneus ventricosus]|uniref:Uncharacterized protein n=1 Tax=Araneus ventricosus TaxID=182803 RepID=A0A4Y2LC62_ARAVE|nr:hypothetical protein AVEN_212065-1 [Araneus ventricosus]